MIEGFKIWLGDPIMANYAGHFGYAFIAFGMYLLARKNILGWISRFVGEVTWLAIGWAIEMDSIWSWGMVFLVMEIYGFTSWYRNKDES